MGFLNGGVAEYVGETIRLAEMAGDDGVVENSRFKDCYVKGPAVLLVEGEFNLVDNEFEGDPEAFLWEIPPSRERVIGAISIKDTSFEGCKFANVGLAGYPESIERIRQGIATQPVVS